MVALEYVSIGAWVVVRNFGPIATLLIEHLVDRENAPALSVNNVSDACAPCFSLSVHLFS